MYLQVPLTTINRTLTKKPKTFLSGWLLTPEDDSGLAGLLLIRGESLNSCGSRHICGYLRDQVLGEGRQKATNKQPENVQNSSLVSDFFYFLLTLFCCTQVPSALAPASLWILSLTFAIFSSCCLSSPLRSAAALRCCHFTIVGFDARDHELIKEKSSGEGG